MVSLKKIKKYAYFCLPLEWLNPLKAILFYPFSTLIVYSNLKVNKNYSIHWMNKKILYYTERSQNTM